jgi:hypothetical protein
MKRDLQVIEIGHGWAVRRQGDLRLLSAHESRLEAEHAALRQAWEDSVEVLVSLPDGRIVRMRPAAPITLPKPTRGRQRQPREL